MVQVSRKSMVLAALLCCSIILIHSQDSYTSPLDTSGHTMMDGRSTPYLVHHLPVNAFPQLPSAVQSALTRRGCLIPQTYEAHQPENVVHASLERPGSSDWAVLCSVNGTVSLLAFLASDLGEPTVVASAPETSRLQSHGSNPALGFNWAIDPASPQQVHEAQLNMRHPPPRPDHDALADSIIDGRTIFRFYSHNTWTTLDTQD
jgi:hypothetical protein